MDEGVLHVEIEHECRANAALLVVAPVQSVLPLRGDGSWVYVSSCSAYEAGGLVPSANSIEKTLVFRCHETVRLAWHLPK